MASARPSVLRRRAKSVAHLQLQAIDESGANLSVSSAQQRFQRLAAVSEAATVVAAYTFEVGRPRRAEDDDDDNTPQQPQSQRPSRVEALMAANAELKASASSLQSDRASSLQSDRVRDRELDIAMATIEDHTDTINAYAAANDQIRADKKRLEQEHAARAVQHSADVEALKAEMQRADDERAAEVDAMRREATGLRLRQKRLMDDVAQAALDAETAKSDAEALREQLAASAAELVGAAASRRSFGAC